MCLLANNCTGSVWVYVWRCAYSLSVCLCQVNSVLCLSLCMYSESLSLAVTLYNTMVTHFSLACVWTIIQQAQFFSTTCGFSYLFIAATLEVITIETGCTVADNSINLCEQIIIEYPAQIIYPYTNRLHTR